MLQGHRDILPAQPQRHLPLTLPSETRWRQLQLSLSVLINRAEVGTLSFKRASVLQYIFTTVVHAELYELVCTCEMTLHHLYMVHTLLYCELVKLHVANFL